MSEENEGKIKLIVAASPGAAGTGDRLGGEEHGLIGGLGEAVAKCKTVVGGRVAEGLRETLGQFARSVGEAVPESVGGWSVEEVTLSLGITGEGDIGVATAGVEGTISVTLKRSGE